jgi:hypothetical protein
MCSAWKGSLTIFAICMTLDVEGKEEESYRDHSSIYICPEMRSTE